jgi:hypothetical protein
VLLNKRTILPRYDSPYGLRIPALEGSDSVSKMCFTFNCYIFSVLLYYSTVCSPYLFVGLHVVVCTTYNLVSIDCFEQCMNSN